MRLLRKNANKKARNLFPYSVKVRAEFRSPGDHLQHTQEYIDKMWTGYVGWPIYGTKPYPPYQWCLENLGRVLEKPYTCPKASHYVWLDTEARWWAMDKGLYWFQRKEDAILFKLTFG